MPFDGPFARYFSPPPDGSKPGVPFLKPDKHRTFYFAYPHFSCKVHNVGI
jgi:hypothetical protein